MSSTPVGDDGVARTFLSKLVAMETMPVLNALLYLECALATILFIIAMVVAHTANAGFNIVLTSIVLIVFPFISLNVLNYYKQPIYVGGVIGAGLLLTIQCLETAVFWGQLSLCEVVHSAIEQYTCDNKIAYRAISLFTIVIFMVYVAFTIFLIFSRGEVLKEFNEYQEIHTSVPSGDYPFDGGDKNGPPPLAPSADL